MYQKMFMYEMQMALKFFSKTKKTICQMIRSYISYSTKEELRSALRCSLGRVMNSLNKSNKHNCRLYFIEGSMVDVFAIEKDVFIGFYVNEQEFSIHIPNDGDVLDYKKCCLLWNDDSKREEVRDEKSDVETYYVGSWELPAINVKVHGYGGCIDWDELSEKVYNWCWQSSTYDFWESIQDEARTIFPDCIVEQHGRSGGWMVVRRIGHPREWDAIKLMKWYKLIKLTKSMIRSLTSEEYVRDMIIANRWDEPGAEQYNYINRDGEAECLVDLKKKSKLALSEKELKDVFQEALNKTVEAYLNLIENPTKHFHEWNQYGTYQNCRMCAAAQAYKRNGVVMYPTSPGMYGDHCIPCPLNFEGLRCTPCWDVTARVLHSTIHHQVFSSDIIPQVAKTRLLKIIEQAKIKGFSIKESHEERLRQL